jgi:hypothetical protein
MASTSAGLRMSFLNCSCCSSSRARRVGPGYLGVVVSANPSQRNRSVVLKILQILVLPKVLKVVEIRNELLVLEVLLVGQVLQVQRIAEALHELHANP